MYFWNINQLKSDIQTKQLSEKERFRYAFIYMALSVMGFEAMVLMPIENPNMWDSINAIATIVVSMGGMLCAYKANGASAGSDFLGRFFSIGFVVSTRLLAILVPMLSAVFVYYIYAFADEETIVSTPISILPFQIWHVMLYVRICKHMADVKNS